MKLVKGKARKIVEEGLVEVDHLFWAVLLPHRVRILLFHSDVYPCPLTLVDVPREGLERVLSVAGSHLV